MFALRMWETIRWIIFPLRRANVKHNLALLFDQAHIMIIVVLRAILLLYVPVVPKPVVWPETETSYL